MRQLILTAIFVCSIASAAVAEPIPPELVGIWATEDSEFQGEALKKGQAIYIDADGVGGFVGGDGRTVIGVRMVVTSYNPSNKVLGFDLTEYGKVVTDGTLTYDPVQGALFSPEQNKQRYERRATAISFQMRKSLNLEPRTQ